MHLVVLFASTQHAVNPWQQLFGAVVGVQNYRNTVGLCHVTHVVRTGYRTGNGARLVFVAEAFARFNRAELEPLLRDARIAYGAVNEVADPENLYHHVVKIELR